MTVVAIHGDLSFEGHCTAYNNALPQSIGSRTANNDIHSKGSTPPRQVEVSLGLDGVGSAGRYMKCGGYF